MPRLPQPGSDNNEWGDILNTFLRVEHDAGGTLGIRSDGTLDVFYIKPVVGIPANDLSATVQTNLSKASNSVQNINGKTPSGGTVTLVKSDFGLSNVDDTSDADKPISIAAQVALDAKVSSDDSIAIAIAL